MKPNFERKTELGLIAEGKMYIQSVYLTTEDGETFNQVANAYNVSRKKLLQQALHKLAVGYRKAIEQKKLTQQTKLH